MNRRQFLSTGSAATAMAMTARSYGQILGANDRIGLGVIGVGRRGRIVGAAFLADKRARLTAIADTYDVTRLRVLAELPPELPEPAAYNDYEDLLARKDVDAVLISVPDHLHVGTARASLAAGKHVYLEKPTLHRWHEKAQLVSAAAQHKLVLQCGMQQRSGAHYQQAKRPRPVKPGRFGRIGNIAPLGAVPNAPLEAGITASVPVLMTVESYGSNSIVTSLNEIA
jgi:hypothetical protein